MRTLWYAGAVAASGFLLFAAATPAQADAQPGAANSVHLLPRNSAALPAGLGGARPRAGLPIVPGDMSDVNGFPGGGLAIFDPATVATTDPKTTTDPTTTTAPATAPHTTTPATAHHAPTPATAHHAPTPATAHHAATSATGSHGAAGPATATHPVAGSAAAHGKHKKVKPTAVATASADQADPRLHEEPIDGEDAR